VFQNALQAAEIFSWVVVNASLRPIRSRASIMTRPVVALQSKEEIDNSSSLNCKLRSQYHLSTYLIILTPFTFCNISKCFF